MAKVKESTLNKSYKHDKFLNEIYYSFKKGLGIKNIFQKINKGPGDIDLAFHYHDNLVQFEVKTGKKKYIEGEFQKWLGVKKKGNSIFLKNNTFKGKSIKKEIHFFVFLEVGVRLRIN